MLLPNKLIILAFGHNKNRHQSENCNLCHSCKISVSKIVKKCQKSCEASIIAYNHVNQSPVQKVEPLEKLKTD